MKYIVSKYFALSAICLFTLTAFLAPARACLNDRASDSSEQEFKSRYEKHAGSKLLPGPITRTPDSSPNPSAETHSSRSWNFPGLLTLAAGIGLMGGAIFLVGKKLAR